MTVESLKYRLSMIFMIGLVIVVVGYLVYKNYVKSQSGVRYTVCEITTKYISAKDVGKKFEYVVEGKRLEGICTSQKCIDAQIGSRFLMKFWVDNPEWTEVYFDVPVSSEMEVPDKGWVTPPSGRSVR
ncbi:hypothetical protein SAMN04488028_1072 [Reichenbachiella agariperforans]|uniref:Uncharacterized protein n=1 Tax=Reichenbachiella agariperforans TaxID=156994 RepID=A0A1M6U7S0_REIAG|nr:hypothetical protein [Reichenbachiella agariperforans]SHK65302.1 hypothetical protein SAMN04488028_1072 [Reichenbachiella agariperforans]